MNLIILAAGRGRRLYPLTKDRPKSLLELGDGTTLLDRQLTQAVQADCVTRVTVITGYRYDMIDECLAKYRDAVSIATIYNPYFDLSNALMSLWCAHYVMLDEDFFVSNGDNVYADGFLDNACQRSAEGIALMISRKDHYDDDDMKVRENSAGNLAEVSKSIAHDLAQADSVGLLLVRGETARKQYRDTLLAMVHDSDSFNAFWQESLNSVLARGGSVALHEVPRESWAEVDFHPDIEAMRKAVLDKLL